MKLHVSEILEASNNVAVVLSQTASEASGAGVCKVNRICVRCDEVLSHATRFRADLNQAFVAATLRYYRIRNIISAESVFFKFSINILR
jgi:hypothetical protein